MRPQLDVPASVSLSTKMAIQINPRLREYSLEVHIIQLVEYYLFGGSLDESLISQTKPQLQKENVSKK
jgi:hypothetical protein